MSKCKGLVKCRCRCMSKCRGLVRLGCKVYV